MRRFARDILHKLPLIDAAVRRFYWSHVHFPEAELKILNHLKKNSFDLVFDVGAALGSYAFVLSRKSKRVICFEPGDEHFNFLKKARIFSNIDVFNAAVGAQSGQKTLYIPGDDRDARHSATLSEKNPIIQSKGTIEHSVTLVSLDDIYKEYASLHASVDLIKIDVEGYENDVLKGAKAVLEEFYPIIIAEIEMRHNPDYKFAFDMLHTMGYECFAYFEGGYKSVSVEHLHSLQTDENRKARLSQLEAVEHNRYINNFIFQHPSSRVKLI